MIFILFSEYNSIIGIFKINFINLGIIISTSRFQKGDLKMKMKKKIPTEDDLKRLGVESWGTWSKEVSEFDWSYDDTETCYILDGEVEVRDPLSGEKIDFKKGDLVQFERGLKCVWDVKKPVRKYFNFDLEFGAID